MKFDSILERNRFIFLDAEQRAGNISNLRLQVPFELIPNQRVNGKLIEKKCSYIADFVYMKDGKMVVEDVKSVATQKKESYIIKRKLMLKVYGIIIKEIKEGERPA